MKIICKKFGKYKIPPYLCIKKSNKCINKKNQHIMTNSTVAKIIALPLSQRLAFLNAAIKNNTAEPFEKKIIDEILNDNITTSWVIAAQVKEYKRVIDVCRHHAGTTKDLTCDLLVMVQKFQKAQKFQSDAVAFALVAKLQEYYTRG